MTDDARSHTHKYVAIGLVACSMLMHEILVTRICALRLYFHFAFVIISNCLLGLGASGAIILLNQERWKAAPRLWLGRFCAGYLVSLVVTYFVLLRYPLPYDLDLSNPGHLLTLTVFNLLGAVPFVCGGVVIGMLLTFDVPRASKLYAVDLVGAGLGCALCPALLPLVGAGGVFLTTALLALVATVVVVHDDARWGRRAIAVGLALGAVGLALLPSLDRRFPVPSKGLIDYARAREQHHKLGEPYSVWTANSRIDLVRNPPGTEIGVFMRGTKKLENLPPSQGSAGIAQDATAGTTIVNYTADPRLLELVKTSMYSAAFRLKDRPKVLIIGLGGGNDAWAARASGASSIRAVELNWPIVDIHKKILPDYSRALVEDPTVELIVGEGRSALMRETTTYDVIQMTGIDTWTALASGAYVLAENYLYTKEAISSMYRRLNANGIIQISRFSETMEALRLMSNIHAALSAEGVDTIEHSVAALGTPDKMMALQIKKGRYSLDEQWNLRNFADENGMQILYLPNLQQEGTLDGFVRSEQKAKLIRDFPMNISPTDDDKPYFFNYTRWEHPIASMKRMGDIPSVSQGNPFFILSQLLIALVLATVFIVLPVARRSSLPRAGTGRFLVYFAGLGLGFIFIEIAVMQKLTLFLGQPVYSLTVTLFSLLVFTGLGSLTLGERFVPGDSRIFAIPTALTVYVAAFLLVSPALVHHLIGLDVAWRIAITVAVLAPLGFILGIPFAYGLRVLHREAPELVPWAWAINGSFSVVGSIGTVVVSMNLGFAAVLVIAVGVYAVAFWMLAKGRPLTRAGAAA